MGYRETTLTSLFVLYVLLRLKKKSTSFHSFILQGGLIARLYLNFLCFSFTGAGNCWTAATSQRSWLRKCPRSFFIIPREISLNSGSNSTALTQCLILTRSGKIFKILKCAKISLEYYWLLSWKSWKWALLQTLFLGNKRELRSK